MKLFFLMVLCLLACSRDGRAADDTKMTLGFGPSVDGQTNPKMFAAGLENDWGNFALYTHCGALFESPFNPFCALVPSARVQTPDGMFIRMGVGPAWFAHSDSRLSSHYEFNISAAWGYYQGTVEMGLEADHFSNAGLPIANPNPNLGSDHILIYLGFPI